MEFEFLVIVWTSASVAVGFWAGTYGRDALTWGMLSLLVSPVTAAIFLLAIGPKDSGE